jgi:hypothetical protein
MYSPARRPDVMQESGEQGSGMMSDDDNTNAVALLVLDIEHKLS